MGVRKSARNRNQSRNSVAASPSQEKSYALGGQGTMGGWMGSAGYGYQPHEPFTGAWQRNMDNARSAGPMLLSNSAIYACLNAISSDISVMPLQVLKPTATPGLRSPHVNHPYWGLMQSPNDFQTSLQFLQHYFLSKLVFGNTYVLMLRDARSVVYAMYIIDPCCVQVLVADDGSIFYRLGRDLLSNHQESVVVPARDIIHDRMTPVAGIGSNHAQGGALVGTSPLFAAAMSGMMAGRMQMASETFFANMSRASGVLVAPGKIDPVVARELQAQWEANYSGRGLGKTAVLTNGLEFKPMSVNAAESELIAQLRWTVEDIARTFRVPQYMVGEMSKATYRNSEQMSRDYYKQCLQPHMRSLEQCFNKALGLTGGVVVEFDLSDLFRTEIDTRYAAYQIGLNSGFLTINEVRALEDLPPVPGGDEPHLQMQYVPLSMSGQQITPPTDAPAPSPAPAAPAPEPAPAPAASDANKQLALDFDFEPAQMDLLVAAFGQSFNLSENTSNGA